MDMKKKTDQQKSDPKIGPVLTDLIGLQFKKLNKPIYKYTSYISENAEFLGLIS